MKISEIKVGKNWSRAHGEGDVSELAASMREHGQITPVIVDMAGNLVAGFRRLKAAKELGWEEIDATLIGEGDPRVVNLIENLNRENLSLWDEIQAIKEVFGEDATQAEIGRALSKSKTWVKPRLEALKLPKENLDKIRAGEVDITRLRQMLRGSGPSTFQKNLGFPSHTEISSVVTRLLQAGRKDEARALSFAIGSITIEDLRLPDS